MSYEENSHVMSYTLFLGRVFRMHRWTSVMLMGAFACATTLDPASAQDAILCPEATFEIAPTDYSRRLWKHWVDADKDCQDSRQEVLIRDSEVEVTYKDERHCKVATGRWTDPYSGTVITNPSLVDVDHLVALQDAHISGGWEWTPERRQSFANELGDPGHLLATSRSTNRSKGSRGPDEWLPPLASYRCEYIVNWTKTKASWDLEFGEGEFAVITYMMRICASGQIPVLPQG